VHPWLKENTLSLLHAIITLFFSAVWLKTNYDTLIPIVLFNTGGYYIYDIFNVGGKLMKKLDIMNSIYIYHHLVTLFGLSYSPYEFRWMEIMFWSEMANIQTKYVYYLIKQEKIQKKRFRETNMAKFFQFLLYAYVRIYIIPLLAYQEYTQKTDVLPLNMAMPMIPIGVIWTAFIFKSIRFEELLSLNNT
jgi:hypothetical protein